MLKRLITEIHRRSLWQVLAIFLATGWGVLQVIDVLINHGVLPGWVFKAALVLLLVGLPVVLATAFVQEGMAGARDRAQDDTRSDGPDVGAREAAERRVSDAPARAVADTPARAHHRLFTWRNAILGGLGAFALLGFASAGYMGMRSLGIGSPGTLLAQGVLERGAAVLLADFESGADAELGSVVTKALRVDLLQSPAIRLLERGDLGEALQRMAVDATAPISGEVATQLAEREGYAAVVAGDITPAGTGYVLTAHILGGEGFRPLAAFRETARNDGELVDAIERLSRSIRDKVGESLRSVRGGPSLAQVTTASLPALRAYTRGLDFDAGGDQGAALEQYERAISLDSTFAMAYRKVSATLVNLGIRPADRRHAERRAFELRDRLPELERHLAAGYYHDRLSGDTHAAMRAFEQAMLIDSLDASVRNSLAVIYLRLARYEEAAELFARPLRDRPIATLWQNLALARYVMGDSHGAAATLDSALAVLPEWGRAYRYRAQLAAADGDFAAADSLLNLLDDRARTALERSDVRLMRFMLAGRRGRLREAERLRTAPGAELSMAEPFSLASDLAHMDLVRGDTAGALRRIREALANRLDVDWSQVAYPALLILTLTGAEDDAAELLRRWRAEVPDDELGTGGRLTRDHMIGLVALARHDFEGALASLEEVRRRCPGCGSDITAAIARTRDAMGQPDQAIAEYERSLAQHDPGRVYDFTNDARSLRRLAELYEARGEAQKAAGYYARFVDLWKDADSELQPQVRAAQARLERLLPDR
jgi:eukaryotic-like serine/threonine-protein kinase